jgi:hypothetical protein
MTDEERQRTMDFILQHQAHFAVGMQRLEEQQSRFAEQQTQFSDNQQQFSDNQQQFSDNQRKMDRRIDQLRRVVLMTVHQFRRERRDLRERIAALVDSQMRTEEAVRSLTATTDRNGRDIALLRREEREASGGDGGEGTS